MTTFQGSLQLIGDDTGTLRATVDVELGRVLVTAGGQELGSWELPELEVAEATDGLHIWVEQEELLFVTNRSRELARFLGARPTTQPVLQPWEPQQPPAPRQPVLRPLLRAARRRWARLPWKLKALTVAGLILVLLALFAPDVLAVGLVVVAAALMLTGGLALADPMVQAKLPGRPLRWIIAGLGTMIAALALNLVT